MFIRPITKISALADRISLGEVDAPDFGARGRDEIGIAGQRAVAHAAQPGRRRSRMLEN